MKDKLKNIVENSESTEGKIFVAFIQSLIVLSLITFSIETLPDLSSATKELLWNVETITIAIFTIEYVLRLYVADKKFGFIFSFFGLIDLIAILPFYLVSGVDLRTVRIFRFLRLIRILKLARYSRAAKHFSRALVIAREELILFGSVALILLYLSAVGIYYFEYETQPEQFKSIFHSLWWALATLTTVGYGDIYPITLGGKVFTFFILIIGIGVIAVPTGLFASALSQARNDHNKESNPSESQ
ncbi:MAG: ion transporter [Gammaproteobacteria bacterium]|nr:ion transporter [Gammaproteobacteria bacterium]